MDLLLMRSLVAVADHGSITDAAASLYITQSALSRRMQQLEDVLAAPLLQRSRKGAELTELGRLTVQEARVLIERYERLKESLRAHLTLQSGVVRLGGGATAVSFLLPRAIAAFQSQYAGLRFQVREAGSREVETDVLQERLELGIVTLPVHSDAFDVRPLSSDRIVLVASRHHPLAGKKQVAVTELTGQSLVGFEAGSAIRQLIDGALRKAGVEVNVVMELRSIPAILEMVETTQSLAFVSALSLTRPHPRTPVVAVRGLEIARRLAVISKRGRPLSPAAEAFAELLLARGSDGST